MIAGLDPAIQPEQRSGGTSGDDVREARRARERSRRGTGQRPAEALRRHWPEYLMEAAELGLFMVSAGIFGTLLFYPGSPLSRLCPIRWRGGH